MVHLQFGSACGAIGKALSGEPLSTGDKAGIKWKRHSRVYEARLGAAKVEVLSNKAGLALRECGEDKEGDTESMADAHVEMHHSG